MRIGISFIGLIICILLLAAVPLSITISDGNLSIQFQTIVDLIFNYFSSLLNGDAFTYQLGRSGSYNMLQDVPSYFITSLQYLEIATFLTVCLGLIISSWYSKSKKEWLKDIIGFLGTIPDFILVLFLQLGVVFIFQTFGFQVARVASRSAEENAFLLPLITLTIIPTIYLIRTLSERTYDVLTEDYILSAKAKGLQKHYIYINHVIRNILPFLKADLHKVLAIMMSNLFIVEYLFNIRGITAFIFGGFMYNYNVMVNTLFILVFLYLIIYWSIRILIYFLERVFARD
ncbi:ABC transporter permease subunit [Ornithinibacillus sp. 179-J 7C1 HS]|uniref:ABC transporter permease subunit n=1 Tax=Ornithinibacillus sp. 179-J 7C1 HS TaxID=3142384 RepID=UPI0039A1D1DE